MDPFNAFDDLYEPVSYADTVKLVRHLCRDPLSLLTCAVDENGWTHLHHAANGCLYSLHRLLTCAGVDASVLDESAGLEPGSGDDDDGCLLARLLIDAGARVSAATSSGDTPLHVALDYENWDVAKLLVDAGADVSAVTKYGRVPLHTVFEKEKWDMAKLLVEEGADVNVLNKFGDSFLLTAFQKGSWDMARVLVEAGADVECVDRYGKLPADYLLENLDAEVTHTTIRELFTLLTDAGATVDGATAKISPLVPSDVIRAIVPEDTPFWLAANNDAPMLAAELAGGLGPNMKTANGMTLLHWACAGDAPECVQLLLDAGADKEAGTPQPIFYCMHESFDCLKHLVCVLYNFEQLYCNLFVLDYALAVNSPACVTALVGAGAWVTKEEMGATNHWHLVKYFNQSSLPAALQREPVPVDALRALLAVAGERVLGERMTGRPLMHWAVEKSTVDGVRVLVEGGADVSEQYQSFNTVLEYAETVLASTPAPSEVPRLTAIVDYLRTLPCLSQDH